MRILVLGNDVRAAAEACEVDVRHRSYVLTAQDKGSRRSGILNSCAPSESRLFGIGRANDEHGRCTMMVVQFLHETDLCLLLDGFVRRTVFADTESIVRPYELNRQFHQGSHADRRFHIIAENEEGAAGRDDTAVERHTDHDAGHGEFRHTGLEELTGEIAFLEGVGLLEEAVGLIRVGEVRGRNNHVTYVLREEREDDTAGITGSGTGFLLDEAPVDTRYITRHEGLVFVRCKRVGLFPVMVSRVFLISYLTKFDSAVFVEFLYLWEDDEGVRRVTAEVLDRLLEGRTGFAERRSVGGALAFPVGAFRSHATFTHRGMTDDERRTAFLCFGFDDSLGDGVGVIARNLLHEPSPGFVLSGYIFGCHFAATGR